MNTKFYLTILMIASLCMPTYAGGDLEKFSKNADEFLKELEAYMTVSHKAEMVPIFKEFEQKFRSGTYSQDEESRIIELNNQMLTKKMSAKPFFSSYIKSITIIKKGMNGEKHFNEWHNAAEQMIRNIQGRKFKDYKAFLQFSFDFFDRGALRYSKSGISWVAVAEDYTFEFKKDVPQLKMEKFDLVCTKKDQIIDIEGTSGTFYPTQMEWKGKGGKVSWERTKMNDVYVELGEYTINVKKGAYTSKNAKLNYPKFFNQTVLGSFEDKIIISKDPSYPRFVSNEQNLKINDLGNGVQYQGGFKLEGSSVYGVGTKDRDASIKIYNAKNEIALNCKSKVFIIRKGEDIVGDKIDICLYIGKDSITHPSSNLRFNIDKGLLSLFRGKAVVI